MSERMWRQENIPPLLLRVQTCIATLENSMLVPQKTGNQSSSRTSDTTSGYIPKDTQSYHKDI